MGHVTTVTQPVPARQRVISAACGSCNCSKGTRLLTEWRRTERVAYGVEHSPKVAAEYERLMSAAA